MVIALLRAGRGRHPDDHRPFAHAAQLLTDDPEASAGVTTTRARKCQLSVGTARLNIRISTKDLEAIQKRALEEGLLYQTLVASLLHKYASERLREE